MYVLLRVLRLQAPVMRPAALFGAIAFQYSDPLLIHLGNLNLIAVLSWLPWVFAAYALAIVRRRLAWAARRLVRAANYAGHAQSSLYVGLALVVYTALRLARRVRGEAARQAVPALFVVLGLAALLSGRFCCLRLSWPAIRRAASLSIRIRWAIRWLRLRPSVC